MIKNTNNIVLIGPMASGKSSIGKLLAHDLNRVFFDSDQVIVDRNGVSIDHIFDIESELGFRKREESILLDLLNEKEVVISTGGGSILSNPFRDYCKKLKCIVIYLYTTPEEQYRRSLRSKERPLLNNNNRKEIIDSLMKDRKKYYNELATFTIDSTKLNIEQAVETIKKKLLNVKD
jgi:shikimate kinase